MKDPVRAPNGVAFERATILLWLDRNGSVCPITGAPLTANDLTPDTELRTKIMRRHIAKSMGKQGSETPGAGGLSNAAPNTTNNALDDDLYEF
jgi:hypothetical protein